MNWFVKLIVNLNKHYNALVHYLTGKEKNWTWLLRFKLDLGLGTNQALVARKNENLNSLNLVPLLHIWFSPRQRRTLNDHTSLWGSSSLVKESPYFEYLIVLPLENVDLMLVLALQAPPMYQVFIWYSHSFVWYVSAGFRRHASFLCSPPPFLLLHVFFQFLGNFKQAVDAGVADDYHNKLSSHMATCHP